MSDGTELCWLTAAEIRDGLRRGDFTSEQLVVALLERIAALNPRLEAYVTVTADEALDQARARDAERGRGRERGPLHGVPFSLKDVFCTAGIRTTAGSTLLADWVPDGNAAVVDRLAEAGAVLLGKVNSHEFAYGVSTQTVHARTRNPWDATRLPGGSSGGSGAAVAAGLCPFSLGTDTAGSIRIPAAWNGVAGLKPTYGRVSIHNVVAQ
ncbi:MAG TPA: amidase, partial [Geminicoccaceae bacterium]|nr:amidase [Geminicoccaceae bacterium]